MSKMSQLHAELSEQAVELGFEIVEDAIQHGYEIDYEKGKFIDPLESYHKMKMKEKEKMMGEVQYALRYCVWPLEKKLTALEKEGTISKVGHWPDRVETLSRVLWKVRRYIDEEVK